MNVAGSGKNNTLQAQARTMLIHAQSRWPEAVDAPLWPYPLRMANEVHNSTPITGNKNGVTPMELFHKSKVQPNLKHFYPFGCPVFVLKDQMQAGKKLPKWELRARMGIYLGMSLQHARTVALVLNLNTGHVSPQFHVKVEPQFESVRGSLGNLAPPSTWQEEYGFKKSVVQRKFQKVSQSCQQYGQ